MSGDADDIKPVTCTVKAPVYLQIGDTKTDTAHSGVCVVDVTLPFGKSVDVRNLSPHKAAELQYSTASLVPPACGLKY